jgi:hypothetical protein
MNGAATRLAVCGIFLIGLMSACSDSSTPAVAPTPTVNLTGTWIGTVTVPDASARMTWTLTQTDMNVTGPVLVALPSGTVLLNGFLTGTLSGSSLTYTITVPPGSIPLQVACSGQIGGTMTVTIGGTSTLSGTPTVTSSTCGTPPFPVGPITLTKQ